METKKLSRTVLKRLRRKGIILPSSTTTEKKTSNVSANSVNSSTSAKKKKKKKIATDNVNSQTTQSERQPESSTALLEVNSDGKSTAAAPTGKLHHNHNRKDRVVYVNTNYVSSDPNQMGGVIQAELRGLRQQSKNIKSASDLTESQAHVVKRQITKLHGAEMERQFKRPKHCDKTLSQATKELAQLLEKQKAEVAASSKSANL